MFVRSALHVKTRAEWAALAPRRGAERAARSYAVRNMVAIMMRGDDSAVSYLYDVEKNQVVRTVHTNVEWVA